MPVWIVVSLTASVAIPALIAILELSFPWYFVSGVALIAGAALSGSALRKGIDGYWRVALRVFPPFALIGAVLWISWGFGHAAWDRGHAAISHRDYSLASKRFEQATHAAVAPGIVAFRSSDGTALRIGTRGIVSFAHWDALAWLAVARYGEGDGAMAIATMDKAIAEAQRDDVAAVEIQRLREDRAKMIRD